MFRTFLFDFQNYLKIKISLILFFVLSEFLFLFGLSLNDDHLPVGVGDLLAVLYRGDLSVFEAREPFTLVLLIWVFIFLMPCILSAYNVYYSTQGIGSQLLVRTTSRSQWLKGKIVWIFANNLLVVFLQVLIAIICSMILNQGTPLWGFTEHMMRGFAFESMPDQSEFIPVIVLLIVTAYIYLTLVSCLCYLLMCILTLVGGLLTTLVYVFITFLTSLPIFLCTHIMFVRSAPFEPSGPPLYQGIVLGVVALVALFFLTKPLSRFVRF